MRTAASLEAGTARPTFDAWGDSSAPTRAKSYALPGAIIGAVVIGGATAVFLAASCDGDSGTNCSSDTITGGLIGAAAGALIGGLIGSFIYQHPKPAAVQSGATGP
jgi:hypothetical protein